MSGFAAPGDSAVVGVLLGGGEGVCVLWAIRGAGLPVPACHRGELGGKGKKWVLLAGAHPFRVWVLCPEVRGGSRPPGLGQIHPLPPESDVWPVGGGCSGRTGCWLHSLQLCGASVPPQRPGESLVGLSTRWCGPC